ncbi:MAG: hypothetical protein N3E47_02220 [Candidatus Bathyarchaeota archaeon]|nr:hypothetical protein [Candidatus Bathyarchaeota archaeon]
MRVDFLLPLILFSIIAASLLLYRKVEVKVRGILEDKKLRAREVILMVASMGVIVTLIALMPSYLIQILFLFAYFYMLLIFSYLILNKWFLAVFPPAAFTAAYLSTIYLVPENFLITLISMNIFAAFFAIMIITYMNFLFTWKITLIFASLLTVMDFIQVFWTGHMVEAAYKMEALKLPVTISSHLARLGLGDVFLSGLLSAQTATKYGFKTGLITAATISVSLFIFEILILNSLVDYSVFPATIIVLLGWLLGAGFQIIKRK